MSSISQAIDILNSGGIILYPTETVWGIGCLTNDTKSIEKLFQIKNRHKAKKFILLIGDDNKLSKYVSEVPEIAWDIIDSSVKQPTIIYPKAKNIPEILLEKDQSIAIRIVNSGALQQFLKKLDFPLISTSANLSNDQPPNSLKEVAKEILTNVDFILDLPEIKGTMHPSAIIKLQTNGEVEIIRK